jgi:serine protease AprX
VPLKPVLWAGLLLLVVAAAPIPAPVNKQSAELTRALERASAPEHVWVFFRDKDRDGAGSGSTVTALTHRALARRARRGHGGGAGLADQPVPASYIGAVRTRVTRVRHVSRWLNAVSVEADAAQVNALASLPFVERLDRVRRYHRRTEETLPAEGGVRSSSTRRGAYRLDYGASLAQLEQINVPAVHDMGLHGEGTIVAVFDTGFDNLPHEVFAGMNIVAEYDFVNGDPNVADERDRGEGSHGTSTLSVLGGFKEGELIGPAYNAAFLLAKTEDTTRETPVEEDHWVAAAEWAEAQGADVISTSLGYLTYDAPFASYTFLDMNGATAASTRAADLAVERGVVVLASAGNAGLDLLHNTLGAPADGHRVLAIGAVDLTSRRTSFSSVGPSADGRIKPDLAAAGQRVKAAGSSTPRAYGLMSGTSFSCPLAAGVAALVVQAHPTYTPAQVAAVLRSTSTQASAPDNLLGWGIVNALAAIQAPEPDAGP